MWSPDKDDECNKPAPAKTATRPATFKVGDLVVNEYGTRGEIWSAASARTLGKCSVKYADYVDAGVDEATLRAV